jgi:hypothetical protein
MALMRRFISWVALHTEHGSGEWAVNDNTLTVRSCHGVKSQHLGDRTPASVARKLMWELSNEHKDT